MASRRQPCESAGCDSTSTEYEFPSAAVPSTQDDQSHTTHLPTEHKEDSTSITHGPVSSNPTNFSTAELHSQDANTSTSLNEKPVDSTFHPDPLSVQGGPPPYSLPLSANNVLGYGAATAHGFTPQQSAIEALAQYLSFPLSILGTRTIRELGLHLDPDVLMADNWKMMAECMEFSNREIMNFERFPSPTSAVIQAWSRMATSSGSQPTIGDFMNILNRDLGRTDVATDIPDYIMKDVERYQKSLMRRSQNSDPMLNDMRMDSTTSPCSPMQLHSSVGMFQSCPSLGPYDFSSNALNTTFEEKPVATNSSRPVQVQDVTSAPEELLYDAFVLCNIADKEFVVEEFLPKVEKGGKLKLCLADRDVPPGNLAFYQQMDFMFQRSRKLVVILSDEFFASREHDWQSNLAISQDPASRKQRIIPVKYKKITTRNIFDHLGCCDLTRTMQESWFWDKIVNGIKS